MRWVRWLVALGAVPFGVLGYHLLVHDLGSSVQNAVVSVGVAWTFVVAGLVAWARRPQSRIGVLMTFVGYALLFRKLQYSHESALFTLGYAFGEVGITSAFVHTILAYPDGRLWTRAQRWYVGAAYALSVAFPVAMLMVFDTDRTCIFHGCAEPRSLIVVWPDDAAFQVLEHAYRGVAYGAMTILFVALVVQRFRRATPKGRRILAPLAFAVVFLSTRAILESVTQFVDWPGGADVKYVWQTAGQIALPLALLAGVLASQFAKGTIADLVVELARTPPFGVRDALARALDDPSLEVAFWLPERRVYVDADGTPVQLPEDQRAVTHLTQDDGSPIAALVHDPALRNEPGLVEAAGAAARFALENARLQADVRAQLAKVQESRRRIVKAGDERAQKIERDIHDGAQQRLVALALELRIAQRRLGKELDPEVEQLLESAVGELQVAVAELRELARGVHPSVLTEEGLAGAIESLATRTPIPIRVSSVPEERLPAEIEAAAYFVVCEAIANAVKHSQATRVRVSAARTNGRLVVAVEDDGVGGADEAAGSGLRGLVDRVEAHGGTLRIESAPGEGTRVVGELPCAS